MRNANDALDAKRGPRLSYDALGPGGILAVWSAHPVRAFARRLVRAGFAVDGVSTRENGKSPRHVIWFVCKA